jgi:hypothetical protein
VASLLPARVRAKAVAIYVWGCSQLEHLNRLLQDDSDDTVNWEPLIHVSGH